MMTMTEQLTTNLSASVRVELVDNWHQEWAPVFAEIDRAGQRQALLLDEDGWLSARQNLLVAFVDDRPAGHICFRVEPMLRQGKLVMYEGRPLLQARLDAIAVETDTDTDRDNLEQLLRTSALMRSRELSCQQFVGLN